MLAVFLAYVQFRDGIETSDKLKTLYIKSIPEQLDTIVENSGYSEEYIGETLREMLKRLQGE
jgi:hypothetical protein